jgi:hypothetical protein
MKILSRIAFVLALAAVALAQPAEATISGFRITAGISGTNAATSGLTSPAETLALSASWSPANGTATQQASKVWVSQRTLSASSSESLDLAGVLTDSFGATLTFATVKAVYVKAASGNTNNVEIGGAASNQVPLFKDVSDIVVVKPGGAFMWFAPGTGATVTAATGDILKAANSSSGTSVTYDIVIVGT